MQDEETGRGVRQPRRQLVYPFVELYNQQEPEGDETANLVQPLIDELV